MRVVELKSRFPFLLALTSTAFFIAFLAACSADPTPLAERPDDLLEGINEGEKNKKKNSKTYKEGEPIPELTPLNLKAVSGGPSIVQLRWDPPADDFGGPVLYQIYRNEVLAGETSGLFYTDTGGVFQPADGPTAEDLVNDVSPIAYVSFDKSGLQNDTGNTDHDLSVVNGATVENVDFGGKANDALVLNGTNQGATMGVVDYSGNQLSVFARINATSFTNADARILSKATSTNTADHFFMISTIDTADGYAVRVRLKVNGTTSVHIANAGLSASQWHHVGFVYDGNTLEIYQDGNSVYSTNLMGNLTSDATTPVGVGMNPLGTPRNFHGAIDDIFIHTGALSADQVAQLAGSSADSGPEQSLSPVTLYKYHLVAKVGDDKFSTPTEVEKVITRSSVDYDAPTTPGNLGTEALGADSIKLTWDKSTDATTGINRYKIYRNTELVGETEELTYTDTELSGGTSYNYYVVAMDHAGNDSDATAVVSQSTD